MMASQLVSTRLLPVELPEKQEQIDYIYEQPPANFWPRFCRATSNRRFTAPCWSPTRPNTRPA